MGKKMTPEEIEKDYNKLITEYENLSRLYMTEQEKVRRWQQKAKRYYLIARCSNVACVSDEEIDKL